MGNFMDDLLGLSTCVMSSRSGCDHPSKRKFRNQDETQLKVVYRIVGPGDVGLLELAPAVDRVIGEQVKRLVAFAETGKAE